MASFQQFRKLLRDCRAVRSAVLPVLLRHAYFRWRGLQLLTSNRVQIFGLGNIRTAGLLKVGLNYVGFMDHHDRTLIRVAGRLQVDGPFNIGKGCRIDIGERAVVQLGSGYVNPNTRMVIMHGLRIGEGCAISWDCQFLDEDFHTLSHPGRPPPRDPRIEVGDRVWIGSQVTVLKGARIPSGSVVAAGSVVRSRFTEEDTLIAGNPARVIRNGVSWS
jgi:acetyltransferase-like isoleucine patch superfamily enzyme